MLFSQRPRFELCVTARDRSNIGGHVICVVFLIGPDESLTQLGCSDVVTSTSATPCCQIDFVFEWPQMLRFVLFKLNSFHDDGDGYHTLIDEGVVGRADICLTEIVGAAGSIVSLPLIPPRRHSTLDAPDDTSYITIFARRLRLGTVLLRIQGRQLKSSDLFSRKCDACLVINRDLDDGEHIAVAQTEVVKGSNNPQWKPVAVDVRTLCSGDLDKNVVLKVYDTHRGASGNIHKIGSCSISLSKMLGAESTTIDLQHPRGKQGIGALWIHRPQMQVEPDSFDLMCMSQLNVFVAIDFTASNGNQMLEESLHFLDPQWPNAYQSVLMALCPSLIPFARDRPVRLFGYGGRPSSSSRLMTDGCFSLSGDSEFPEVFDTQGVLDAYAHAVNTTMLGGNTEFGPIIQQVIESASSEEKGSDFHVLLILTDGDVCDVEESMDAIVAASSLPICILVVNVGYGDVPRIQQFLVRKVIGTDGLVSSRNVLTCASYRKSAQTAVTTVLTALLDQWICSADKKQQLHHHHDSV